MIEIEVKVDARIGRYDEDFWSLWDSLRRFIRSLLVRGEFQEELELARDDDEAWDIFEEEIVPYVNLAVAPEGYRFGRHDLSLEWGFWKVRGGRTDQPYRGMKELAFREEKL